VQYASAAGTTWFNRVDLPADTVPPGGYYLIELAPGANTDLPALPTPDVTGSINMSATNGKVALVATTAPLEGACPAGLPIVDFVGYGSANFFAGAGAAPTLNNTTSAIRLNGGCNDTDQNAADFAAQSPPEPRGLQTQLAPCVGDTAPSVESTTPASGAFDVPLDASLTVGFSEPVTPVITIGTPARKCARGGMRSQPYT
jgi:hypothetical protein